MPTPPRTTKHQPHHHTMTPISRTSKKHIARTKPRNRPPCHHHQTHQTPISMSISTSVSCRSPLHSHTGLYIGLHAILGFQLFWVSNFWTQWVSIFVGMRSFNFCCLKFFGFSTFLGFQFLDTMCFNSCCLNFFGFLVFGHEEQEIWFFFLFERCWVRLGVCLWLRC